MPPELARASAELTFNVAIEKQSNRPLSLHFYREYMRQCISYGEPEAFLDLDFLSEEQLVISVGLNNLMDGVRLELSNESRYSTLNEYANSLLHKDPQMHEAISILTISRLNWLIDTKERARKHMDEYNALFDALAVFTFKPKF